MSVGIVYYNEVHLIEDCLQSIFSGTNTKYFDQLIVVVNSDLTEDLLKIINEFQLKFPFIKFEIIKNVENNLGESRRVLVNKSDNKFLCITDPDCIVSDDWILDYIQMYESISLMDKFVAGLCGHVKIKSNFKIFKFLQKNQIKTYSSQVDLVSSPTKVDHCQTSNAFFNVYRLKEVGNFSPAYNRTGEDLELGLRLLNNNFTNYSIPGACVAHYLISSKLVFIKRFFKLGLGQNNPFVGERKLHTLMLILLFLVTISFIYFDTKTLLILMLLFCSLFTLLKVSFKNLTSLVTATIAYAVGFLSSALIQRLD